MKFEVTNNNSKYDDPLYVEVDDLFIEKLYDNYHPLVEKYSNFDESKLVVQPAVEPKEFTVIMTEDDTLFFEYVPDEETVKESQFDKDTVDKVSSRVYPEYYTIVEE